MTINRISGTAIILFALYMTFETSHLPLGTTSHPGPAYLPLLLTSLMGIMGVILIFFSGRSSPTVRSIVWPEGIHAMTIVLCCFFATFAIEILGYRITMMIILGFLFGVLERMKVWWVLALTLGFSCGSYWLFNNLLNVMLPRGGLGF
jgi:hypothetical protein